MTRESAYIRKFRELVRTDPQFMHIEALEEELYNSPSDRATVVMFGSFVETHLERLLLSIMRENLTSEDRKQLFEFEGAMGSFSSKIISAYALKLLGPISRGDLDLIRHLRNGFAHSRMSFNFQTAEVRAVCDHLRIVDQHGSVIPHGYLRRVGKTYQSATDLSDPKTRFISACHNLSYRMLVKRDGPKAGDIAFRDDEPLP